MPQRANVTLAPGSLPVIGHALELTRRPLKFVTSLPRYGDVVEVRLGTIRACAITSPELAWQLLVPGDRDYAKGLLFEKMGHVAGPDGLVSTSGTKHRRLRRMMQPAFSAGSMEQHFRSIKSEIDAIVSGWDPGQTLMADQVMNELSLTVITRTLFANELGDQAFDAVRRNAPRVFDEIFKRAFLPDWYGKLPTPGNRQYNRSKDEINRCMSEAVAAYRASRVRNNDILSHLLAAQDGDGNSLSDREIVEQGLNVILAASELPGSAMAWAMHEISQNPEIESKLHRELDAVLRTGQPTLADIEKLTYTRNIINETLRVYASWFLMRKTVNSVRLGEIDLAAGTEIIYSPYQLHRDARWYPEPYTFDPDRWERTGAVSGPKGSFIPFSAGAHKCIGENLSMIEMIYAIAAICSRWVFRRASDEPVREVPTGAVHPSALPMLLQPRRMHDNCQKNADRENSGPTNQCRRQINDTAGATVQVERVQVGLPA
jgi:cytochrome P450